MTLTVGLWASLPRIFWSYSSTDYPAHPYSVGSEVCSHRREHGALQYLQGTSQTAAPVNQRLNSPPLSSQRDYYIVYWNLSGPVMAVILIQPSSGIWTKRVFIVHEFFFSLFVFVFLWSHFYFTSSRFTTIRFKMKREGAGVSQTKN